MNVQKLTLHNTKTACMVIVMIMIKCLKLIQMGQIFPTVSPLCFFKSSFYYKSTYCRKKKQCSIDSCWFWVFIVSGKTGTSFATHPIFYLGSGGVSLTVAHLCKTIRLHLPHSAAYKLHQCLLGTIQ